MNKKLFDKLFPFIVFCLGILLGIELTLLYSRISSNILFSSNSEKNIVKTTNISPSPSNLQPSERALKASSNYYIYSSPEEQKRLIKDWAGTGTKEVAIYNMALYLDSAPSRLALVESSLEKFISESSKKNVYVESPQPIYQTPVSVQNNKINCTSNKIGDFVYTNCY